MKTSASPLVRAATVVAVLGVPVIAWTAVGSHRAGSTLSAAGAVAQTSANAAGGASGIAAVVNGESISIADVKRVAVRAAGATVLDQLIGNILIDQEAKKENIAATPSEVEARISHIRDLIKPHTLEEGLKKRHMTLDLMRDQLRVEVEVEKLMRNSQPKATANEAWFQQQAPKYVRSLRDKANVQLYPVADENGPSGIAASVNGQTMPRSEVEDLSFTMAGPAALDRLIDMLVVEQEARKQGVIASPAETDAKIDRMRDHIQPESLDDWLTKNNTSMSDFRRTQEVEIESDKLLWKSLGPINLVRAEHIFLLTDPKAAPKFPGAKPRTDAQARALMASIQKQLTAGAKFEDLAKRYSDDTATRGAGGDLGIIGPDTPFGGEFFSAVSHLKKGDVTPKPVKSPYGLHLITAVSTMADYSPSEKQLYARAEDNTHMQEVQLFLRGYVKALRGHAKITNYLTQ